MLGCFVGIREVDGTAKSEGMQSIGIQAKLGEGCIGWSGLKHSNVGNPVELNGLGEPVLIPVEYNFLVVSRAPGAARGWIMILRRLCPVLG